MGRYNLPFALCTNSTKRTLVKDLHFIGPKLSHLIKLTVTEWATQGQRGDREIGRCQTRVTLKYTFNSADHLKLGERNLKRRRTPLPLNNIVAVKKSASNDRLCCNLVATFAWNTLDFNDGHENPQMSK